MVIISAGDFFMKSINPATGKIIKEYAEFRKPQVDSIIKSTHETQLKWRETSFKTRSALMKKAAKILTKNQNKYASIITAEMGKTLSEAIAEIKKCAVTCEYYADNAERFLKDEILNSQFSTLNSLPSTFVTFQPLGIILAIMPWNFPFWQVFRAAIPALMAGNGMVLKHASNVSGSALAIEEVFREAGFPGNLFRTILISSDKVSSIIENKYISAVTLTGSTNAGRAVAAKAGECLKKTVLELGGNDAYIVLKDADIDLAVRTCIKSRLINAGQSCIAAKRFIIVKEIYDEFLKKFISGMEKIKFGDPLKSTTDIGPLVSIKARDDLHKQVMQSISKGAKLLTGGYIPKINGAYYPATVLVNVKTGMPAHDDELFGPVASVIKAKDEKDAIRIANDSVFGLGGAVFTKDCKKGKKIARDKIESGACFVNSFVKSDPSLPFGGIKQSGYGRELSGFGIREFTNIKTISIG